MLFAVSKETLLAALERVSRVVKSNPRSVDILQCVKIHTYGGDVYMTATSPMASVKVQITPAVVKETGEFVVNADRLKDRVSKSADKMTLMATDTSLRIVSSNDQKLGLTLNDLREFPEIEWTDPEESYGVDKKILTNLLKVSHSITTQVTSLTPAFMQVYLSEQKLWVANGMAYQVFPMECNPHLKSSIPTQTLFALTSFVQEAEGDTVWLSQLSEGEEVVVSVGQDQFQTNPLAVEFPNLEPTFERVRVATHHECIVDRKRLTTELTKAKTSTDNFGRVTLEIEGLGTANMFIRTQSNIGDWYESKVPCIWTGPEERALTFNLESLLKFLQTFDEDSITLYIGDDFKGDLSPLYCKEDAHEGIINQFRV